MTIDTSPSLGLGQISREAYLVLLEVLNEQIEQQAEYWEPLDEELAEKRGIEYQPLTLETIDHENFCWGHTPSLIKAPIERYPNVAVDADRAGSAQSDSLDQALTVGVFLYIEFMVKSVASEEEVSARASRTLDAIHFSMMSNRTLRGASHEIGTTPNAQLSDVFVRKERTSNGDRWFWRGGRLEYSVTKVAQFPSGSSLTAADRASIDQS